MNTRWHAVTDISGRPIQFFLTAGQARDCTGASTCRMLNGYSPTAAMIPVGPQKSWLAREPPPHPLTQVSQQYRQIQQVPQSDRKSAWSPHRLGANFNAVRQMPNVFLSAIALAEAVIVWLWLWSLVHILHLCNERSRAHGVRRRLLLHEASAKTSDSDGKVTEAGV